MDQKYAVLIVTHDQDNTYAEAQFNTAITAFEKSAAFLKLSDGVYLIDLNAAFPVLTLAYAEEARCPEFKVRFAVIPCSPTVFGAFLKVEGKVLAEFGLEHWETPVPAMQPRR